MCVFGLPEAWVYAAAVWPVPFVYDGVVDLGHYVVCCLLYFGVWVGVQGFSEVV